MDINTRRDDPRLALERLYADAMDYEDAIRDADEATVSAALLTPDEAAIALGWCDVVDANSPLEPEHEEAALIAKLRRIAGDS